MSSNIRGRQEKIEQEITKLIEESEKGKPIVVEGKKDIQTLRKLGINGTILAAKTGGKSFLEVTGEIEKLHAPEIILLLDFDRRGKEGTKKLKEELEHSKIKVDMRFWQRLHSLIGREVQCIESLSTYLETINNKTR